MATLTINGRDTADLGFRVVSLADWWALPEPDRGATAIPGRRGVRASDDVTWEPKVIGMEAMLRTTVDGRIADLDAVRELTDGLLEVSVGDDADRVAYGVLETDDAQALIPRGAMGLGHLVIPIDLVLYDPTKYDRLSSTLVIPSTGRTDVPMGTAPMHGTLIIMGSATTPKVTVRSQGGEELDSMTFASLATDEYYEVDLDAQTVVEVDSGVRSDAFSSITDGWFFSFDPSDSPTIEIDSGSAVLHYRRRWLS